MLRTRKFRASFESERASSRIAATFVFGSRRKMKQKPWLELLATLNKNLWLEQVATVSTQWTRNKTLQLNTKNKH